MSLLGSFAGKVHAVCSVVASGGGKQGREENRGQKVQSKGLRSATPEKSTFRGGGVLRYPNPKPRINSGKSERPVGARKIH